MSVERTTQAAVQSCVFVLLLDYMLGRIASVRMIEVKNLYKGFGDKTVLHDVSVEIRDAQTYVILGQSGSGKSVLLKNIIGLLQPDSGQIIIDGIDTCTLSYREIRRLRESFGVLFQGGALFDSMTAYDNVAFPLRMVQRMPERLINDRVMECLELVAPSRRLPRKCRLNCLAGCRNALRWPGLSRSNLNHIFYDEPTSGLDPKTSNTINDLIKDLDLRLGVTGSRDYARYALVPCHR